MLDQPIPDDVRRFIIRRIDSIAQLEALLLLRGTPSKEWSIEEVSKSLYINEEEASFLLKRLYVSGLIDLMNSDTPAYKYQTTSSDLTTTVDRLAETYSKHLVPVTNLVHSKGKLRIQEFADAFKLRKDK